SPCEKGEWQTSQEARASLDRGPRGCRQGSRAPGYLWEGLPG
ncbi:hypothetical protein CLOP_g19575, partial [Closterium sp. NIES-67]